MDQIGNEIDFLILDTTHSLPGELLDFLSCLPYLKKGAVTVLHDINLHHIAMDATFAYATQVLFDVVVAEKILGIEEDSLCGYPNIGAFVVTEDTLKYSGDLFSALMLKWHYSVPEQQLELYRQLFEKFYSEEEMALFDMAVQSNQHTLKYDSDNRVEMLSNVWALLQEIKDKKVYIYGCGMRGRLYYKILLRCNVNVQGYIVSDGQPKEDGEADVYYISEVKLDPERDVILVGVGEALQEEICATLQLYKIDRYILPNKYVLGFIRTFF